MSGELELAVERLTSGNQLYDRELRRRIDARRYPDHRRPGHRHRRRRLAPRLRRSRVRSPSTARRGRSSTGCRSRLHEDGVSLTGEDVFDIREFGMKPPSMLMVRVYPEISVRVELHGDRDT